MLIRSELRCLSPNDPASNLESAFTSDGSGGETDNDQIPDEFKTNPLFQRLYNENRKTQRLLSKKDRELDSLRNDLNEIKQLKQVLAQLSGVNQQQGEAGNKQRSYLDKVREADRMIREQDPNSGGLSLTLEGAELLEKLRSENEELKRMAQNMMQPQYAAEQLAFVNIETNLKQQIEELYGSQEAIEENYPDFERVAIQRLKAVKADPKKWSQLVTSQKLQNDFVKNIITAKIPKLANVPGWQKVDTYGVEDAKKDLARADELAKAGKRDEASRLQAKARQALLPYTLGIAMDN